MRKVKLSFEDQIKLKEKREKDIIKLNQLDQHQSLEVKVHQKTTTNDSKFIDDYDRYIIEKALSSLKSEFENQSLKTNYTSDEAEMELAFHEQYFS